MSMSTARNLDPCPRPGCKSRRPRVYFACRRCWFSLPARIRENVWAAWRRYQGDANQLGELRDAQQEAVDYWRQLDHEQ